MFVVNFYFVTREQLAKGEHPLGLEPPLMVYNFVLKEWEELSEPSTTNLTKHKDKAFSIAEKRPGFSYQLYRVSSVQLWSGVDIQKEA